MPMLSDLGHFLYTLPLSSPWNSHLATEVIKGCGTGTLADIPKAPPVKGNRWSIRVHTHLGLVPQLRCLQESKPGIRGRFQTTHQDDNKIWRTSKAEMKTANESLSTIINESVMICFLLRTPFEVAMAKNLEIILRVSFILYIILCIIYLSLCHMGNKMEGCEVIMHNFHEQHQNTRTKYCMCTESLLEPWTRCDGLMNVASGATLTPSSPPPSSPKVSAPTDTRDSSISLTPKTQTPSLLSISLSSFSPFCWAFSRMRLSHSMPFLLLLALRSSSPFSHVMRCGKVEHQSLGYIIQTNNHTS